MWMIMLLHQLSTTVDGKWLYRKFGKHLSYLGSSIANDGEVTSEVSSQIAEYLDV